MMALCGLCVRLFIFLYIQGMQGSPRLDSLTCANNFKSHWICHWKESAEENRMLPMNLYYKNSIPGSRSQRCIPESPHNQEGDLFHMRCQFSDTFGSVNGIFTFVPSNATIINSSKVRVPTPENLRIHKSNDGFIILNWKMPKYSPPPDSLTFQVAYYRKDWEVLEDAASITVLGKMEAKFNPQSLVPGSIYLFRVRSLPHEKPAYRSTWSKELVWTMPEEEGGIPQNLQCEYDGLMEMRCSWEVRKGLARSVSYALYYTIISADREKSCLGTENKVGRSYVRYSCILHIPPLNSTDSFNIQLRPLEEVKTLEADKNIQLNPPSDLQVKDRLRHGYILSWSPSAVEFSTIQLTYQLCYWKQGDPECLPHTLANVSNNLLEYYIPLSELEGSMNYTAKVRAKPDEEFLYNGPWSEWSEPCSWKTHRVSSTEMIYIATIIISMVLSVLAFLGSRSYRRLKQQWEDSLPDPSKSKLILEYRVPVLLPFIRQNYYGEEEKASVCVPVSPINTAQTVEEPEETPKTEKNPNLLGPYALVPPTQAAIVPCQSRCESLDSPRSGDVTARQTLEPAISQTKSPPSSNNSNGSCVMYTSARSMSDFCKKRLADPQYFCVPSSQEELFHLTKEVIQPCQPAASKDQMGYVLSMDNKAPIQTIQGQNNTSAPDKSKYFAIPLPSDFSVTPEGPLMIMNPDGSGPLMLKQVGDYCFFPRFHETSERKNASSSEPQHQEVPRKDQPLSAATFKVMPRGYLSLPQV